MSEYIVDFKNAERVSHFESLFADFTAPIREEIVRCRDCINYSGEDNEIYPKWCMQMNITEVEPNGFCAWAERSDA